jgi:hypothetical protein
MFRALCAHHQERSNCTNTTSVLVIPFSCVPYECAHKGKVKSLPGAFLTLRPREPIVFLPQQVPAFISRGATHHIDERDLYQRRRELPPSFASGSEFTRIPLGIFTCRKAGTWDILFYFPSEGRHTEDFSDAGRIQRLRPVC